MVSKMTTASDWILIIVILVAVAHQSNCSKRICDTKRNLYIEAYLQFVRCAMHNSVPVTACLSCLSEYLNLLHIFNDFVNTQDNTQINTFCRSAYIDQNRLNILSKELDESKNIWNNAFCTNCYADCDPEALPSNCTKSDQALQYEATLNTINQCIDASARNVRNPCEECALDYGKLDSIYNNIRAKSPNICYDLEDMMNHMQKRWTWVLSCGRNPTPTPDVAPSGLGFFSVAFIVILLGGAGAGGAFFYKKRTLRYNYTRSTDRDSETSNLFTTTGVLSMMREDTEL